MHRLDIQVNPMPPGVSSIAAYCVVRKARSMLLAAPTEPPWILTIPPATRRTCPARSRPQAWTSLR